MPCQIRRSHDDYTVAWICAIPLEMAAATAMLDEIHQDLPVQSNDHNSYSLGRIWGHNVVVACLPNGKYGTVSASSVVVQLISSFRSIRFGLMVGIGGGVPSSRADIRLGDIVVSKPTGIHGGVVEYDYGKVLSDGNLERTGMLSRPPKPLLTALSRLEAHHINHGCRFLEFQAELENKTTNEVSNFTRPLQEDLLYLSEYTHIDVHSTDCIGCDPSKTVVRPSRAHTKPVVHYGLIASANQVVKNSNLRDKLGRGLGAYCVEMEAAGVMDNLPCMVIRGICDYADSHKNDAWQGYAAGMAAAYAKELLLFTAIVQHTKEEFHVPFDLTNASTVKNFIGRKEELEKLWDHLRPSGQNSQKVAVLHALGGMGKTQLAACFARTHKKDFTAILWLNGKTRETLLQSLSSVLSRLPNQDQPVTARTEEEVKQNATQVLQWLVLPENNNWLLIFDNIDQYSPGTSDGYDVGKFFPTADHGSILITSRLLSLTELGMSLPLQKLDPTHATQLLLQSTGLSCQDVEESNQDIIEIVRHLDGLPLAISLAGAFMRETGTSISKYLQYYRESWHSLQSRPSSNRHYEHDNILQTWLVSYHEIEKRDPEAAQLMLIIAHFDNQDIWRELLISVGAVDYSRWLVFTMSDEIAFRERMSTLIGFSFVIAQSQSDSYSMHPVVRDWCLYIAESRNNQDPDFFKETALIAVGTMAFDSGPSPCYGNSTCCGGPPCNGGSACWTLQQRLLPHASYVLGSIRSLPRTTSSIEFRNALFGIGKLYTTQCRLEEAEEPYHRALAACQLQLAPVSPYSFDDFTLHLYHSLAQLYDTMARIEAAEKIYEDILAAYMLRAPYYIVTLCAMMNLGNFYSRYNFFDKAEKVYQRARSSCYKALGPDHTLTLDSIESLGRVYLDLGQVSMAEPLCQAALEAFIYQCQGRTEEAEEMYRRSQVPAKILESDHLDTTGKLLDMAVLYERQGKYDAAERLFAHAVSKYTSMFGPGHILTLNSLFTLGSVYWGQNRLAEAEDLYWRVRSGYERILGPHHPLTKKIVENLNLLTQLQDAPKDGKSLYFVRPQGVVLGPNAPTEVRDHEELRVFQRTRSMENMQTFVQELSAQAERRYPQKPRYPECPECPPSPDMPRTHRKSWILRQFFRCRWPF
ncbi:uncharacterized protein BDV17DRAFT_164638 [Aspergillus undulatus]|uniref:uncharacterized protein n=1 Tax=Aspergillus undulatus TaxID=1810928 RepID=UPI003CCD4590